MKTSISTDRTKGLTRQPQKGDRVAWRDSKGKLHSHATVLRIEGNLCWCEFDKSGMRDPFIWRFHDGSLNKLAEILPITRRAETPVRKAASNISAPHSYDT